MAGTKLTADAQGRLVVPDDPIVPVVEGDGAGPALWRGARAALEAAVQAAYGGRRRVEFVTYPGGDRGIRESRTRAPEATLNAFRQYRVGLVGAQRSARDGATLHGELQAILDLYASVVRIREPEAGIDLVLVREDRELGASGVEVAPGSAAAQLALDALEAVAPAVLDEQRFATAEKADRARESRGDLAIGLVEAALSWRDVSAFGTKRLVETGLRFAAEAGLEPIGFVSDVERLPKSEGARRTWADAVAAEASVALVHVPTTRFVSRILSSPKGVYVGSADAIDAVVDVLWSRLGDPSFATVARVNGETGHALFGPLADPKAIAQESEAHPFGLVCAGEALLRHFGWVEAADAIRAVVADVRKSGVTGPGAGEAMASLLRG